MSRAPSAPHLQFLSLCLRGGGGAPRTTISIETEFSTEGAKLLAHILSRNSKCALSMMPDLSARCSSTLWCTCTWVHCALGQIARFRASLR
jgi:hypothetical protein